MILGRTVRWKDDGIYYEADEKHRILILESLGLVEGQTKSLAANGEKDFKEEEHWELEEVGEKEATEFRGCIARLNFLAQDSPELMFVAKEMSREMVKPKRGSWKRFKKIARFILGRSSVTWKYDWQEQCDRLDVYTDSDWGGGVGSRRSTSGGVLMLGSHCIRAWSSTQGAVALSSAEAEFYAMVEGALRGKGLVSLARELGLCDVAHTLKVFTDSSAAKSFVSRRGLGKMKHIEIRELWLQHEVLKGSIEVQKVRGVDNPADLMTKVLNRDEIDERLGRMGIGVNWAGN